ncbi:hypothetical protein ACOME3_001290 [Neoechinorhynchus agilis]
MGSRNSVPLELTSQLVEFLSGSLNCDEKTIWESYERFKKYAPTLKMDKRAFISRFRENHPHSNVTKIAEIVFKYFDSDCSGYVTFSEYFIPNAFIFKADAKQRAGILFDICDSNNDNIVTCVELAQMIEGLSLLRGEFVKKKELDKIAKKLSVEMDCDGNRKITKHEFVYAMLAHKEVKELLDFNCSNI